MSLPKSTSLLGVLALASRVYGHGYVSGIVADGAYYGGYLVDKYPYTDSPPETAGWSTSATDLGFVAPDSFSSPDIVCHQDAEPGAISVPVAAGGTLELQWNEWPESHHGPVVDYLANCNGDCASVDKTALEFFKIAEAGLNDGSNPPGNWATDDLIANNNSWAVTIPESIAPGSYVLRHELIALHSAGEEGGAQNYPQCINVEVTGGGSENPQGTAGTELYTASDEGIVFNIYTQLDDYPIPGPEVFGGGSDSPQQPPVSSPRPSSQPPTPTSRPTSKPVPTQPPNPSPTNGNPPGNPPDNPPDNPPQLPIDLPEDLTEDELLLIAQEILDRLGSS